MKLTTNAPRATSELKAAMRVSTTLPLWRSWSSQVTPGRDDFRTVHHSVVPSAGPARPTEVAATASAQTDPPGGVLAIAPDQVAEWLAPLPVDALHGIGPRQADTLRDYGIHSVGLLAAVPAATVQCLLGGRAGRLAADRARGIDPRPVVPRSLPESVTVRRSFPRHALDGAEVRAALLALVVRLGRVLRRRGQAARAVTLVLRFAGGSRWEKTRRLGEPSAHDDDCAPWPTS